MDQVLQHFLISKTEGEALEVIRGAAREADLELWRRLAFSKLRSASGAEGEPFGTTRVRKRLGNQAYEISSVVAAVSGPIASLSWLEDAGWTFESAGAGRNLRCSQEEIEVPRRDAVHWILVDDAEDQRRH